MVFVNESLEEMLKKIKCKRIARKEVLIPREDSLIFYPSKRDSNMIMIAEEYIIELGEFTRRNFSVIFELYSNALNRGNNSDWNLPVTTTLFGGTPSSRGTVLRIEDSGPGFPFKEIIKKWGTGEFVGKNNGNGMDYCGCYPNIYVSYEGKGNIVNVRSPINL